MAKKTNTLNDKIKSLLAEDFGSEGKSYSDYREWRRAVRSENPEASFTGDENSSKATVDGSEVGSWNGTSGTCGTTTEAKKDDKPEGDEDDLSADLDKPEDDLDMGAGKDDKFGAADLGADLDSHPEPDGDEDGKGKPDGDADNLSADLEGGEGDSDDDIKLDDLHGAGEEGEDDIKLGDLDGDTKTTDDDVTVVVVSPEHLDQTDEKGDSVDDEDEDNKFKKDKDMSTESHIKALLSGQDNLSEDFKQKTKVIFEAAINEQVKAHKKVVTEQVVAQYNDKLKAAKKQLQEQLNVKAQQIEDDLTESVTGFLQVMVERWVRDNQVALERNMRSELTEGFIDGLKNLFEEHYIDVPEKKFDLIEAQETQIRKLEEKLQQAHADASKALNESTELQRKFVIAEASKGLTDTQKVKLNKLVESVDFEDADKFGTKVGMLVESYFAESKSTRKEPVRQQLVEDIQEQPKGDAFVSGIAQMMARMNPSV